MWRRDPSALELLEEAGPFEQRLFRDAAIRALPGYRDLSFGAASDDGTRAAIALAGTRFAAESFPPSVYGGICSTRALTEDETKALLGAARKAAGVAQLVLRWPRLSDGDESAGARSTGIASVVFIDPDAAPESGYSRLARRSIRRAQGAGCTAAEGNVEDFLSLYGEASKEWRMQYPSELITATADAGIACCDVVYQGGVPVAGLFTLKGATHWMCWLAAQNAAGRDAAASYLAYDVLLERAWKENVPAVSFGSSAPGSGGEQFKHYLGAVEVPTLERVQALMGAVTASRIRSAVAFHAGRVAGNG